METNKHNGTLIANHWGKFDGDNVPDELKIFMLKYVKKSPSGNYYVCEYNDEWYNTAFRGSDIIDFKTFMEFISPYFTVQRVQPIITDEESDVTE